MYCPLLAVPYCCTVLPYCCIAPNCVYYPHHLFSHGLSFPPIHPPYMLPTWQGPPVLPSFPQRFDYDEPADPVVPPQPSRVPVAAAVVVDTFQQSEK